MNAGKNDAIEKFLIKARTVDLKSEQNIQCLTFTFLRTLVVNFQV